MRYFAATIPAVFLLVMPVIAAAGAYAKPPEIASVIKQAAPHGEGKLQRLLFVAYKASLWTDAKPWSYNAPFALSITYNMGFTKEELVDRTISEMAGQSESPAPAESYRNVLNQAFTDVKDGERFTALMTAKKSVKFYHNGTFMSEIADPVFAKRFFDIWLSSKTTEPSLRSGLLRVSE